MTDWRKSQDGYHAYVGPLFARVAELPQSSDRAGSIVASVESGGPAGRSKLTQYVNSYEAGMQACDEAIDEYVREIRRARRRKNKLADATPQIEHTRTYGPGDER